VQQVIVWDGTIMRHLLTRSFGPLVSLLALSFAVARAADSDNKPAPLPQWQRYLQGDDAKQAADWEKELIKLVEAGQLNEALAVAERVKELRSRRQKDDHWQTVNAHWQVEALQRVLAGGKEDTTAFATILAMFREADDLLKKGNYRQEGPIREKLLALHRKLLGENHPITALSYNNLAANQNAQGKYAEAEAGYRKALELHRQLLGENHPTTATIYNNLAANQNAQGKYAEAEVCYRKALDLRLKLLGENHPSTATSYHNLAHNQNAQGKYAEAEVGFRKALDLYLKLLGENHRNTAISYNNLAGNQDAQGKYAEAEVGYRKALELRLKLLSENHPDTAQSYNNLASNQGAQGKYAEAEAGYRKALGLRLKLLGENHPSTATSYNNLAHNENARGKYAEAEACYRKALGLRLKLLGESHPDTALSYNNLASNQDAQGRYAEAEVGFRKALELRLKLLGENHPDTASSFNNLAGNQEAQGKYTEAEAGFRKALELRLKLLGETHPHTALSYNNLASNQGAQGKYAEAEAGYRKALELRLKLLGENHFDTATSYNNLASNQGAQGKYAEAEVGYRKALDLNRKLLGEDHPTTAASYNNLALNQNAQGKYVEAETLLTRGAASFDHARVHAAATGLERATATGKVSPHFHLAAVLAHNSKPESAWQHLEQGLGRGMWDDLATRRRYTPDERAKQVELEAHVQRIDQLLQAPAAVAGTPGTEERRAQLLTQRLAAQEALTAFTKNLKQKYGPVAGQVFDLLNIQAALPSDAALVGWIDVDGEPHAKDPNGEHWAFLLRYTGAPVCKRLVGTGPDESWSNDDSQLVSKLRDALPTPKGDWRPLAQKLHAQRFDPLQKHLDGIRRLIVLPSRALAGIPVEILADDRAVSYALSGTMFAYLHKQPRPESRALLALADPVFKPGAFPKSDPLLAATRHDDTWAPLPGTRAEAETLRRLAAEPAPLVLTGSDASEQRLHELAASGELSRFRYLHLATHGIADNRLPLHSAIILSRDKLPDPEKQMLAGQPIFDGRLTAREVLQNWELNAELVTLSACQTALGKYEGGEGFLGFAQALTIAGSRAVCLSLWKVDDTATALLMERFYQNLLGKRPGLEKPLGKATALAEAKAWLRDLPRAEAVRRNDLLAEAVNRGKDRPVQPLLSAVPEPSPTATAKSDRPYAHPYYWAAFILIGDPD
jgi:CHAT domain-containing protein/tetratricopeptide (TPR) repeat protein